MRELHDNNCQNYEQFFCGLKINAQKLVLAFVQSRTFGSDVG